MAGRRRKITMQGVGNPVSAVGQGGKAGPQSSPSCDRSSSCVGNLAYEGYKATRSSVRNAPNFHDCDKNCDLYCNICCKYVVCKMRVKITDPIKNIYMNCFGRELLHLDKKWVPNIICGSCKRMLYRWNNDKVTIKFSTPASWNRPTSENDCYFCANDVTHHNQKNMSAKQYVNVSSVIQPIETDPISEHLNQDQDPMEQEDHSNDLIYESTNKCSNDNDDNDNNVDDENDDDNDDEAESFDSDSDRHSDFLAYNASPQPKLISQEDLNDLVRDLNLPKDGSEHLASFLKSRHLLKPEVRVSFYRNRDEKFRKYFTMDNDLSLAYCIDVKGLIDEYILDLYKPEEWRLFIDSSKRSIKAVLLHNTNVYAPIPIAHSTVMKEQYQKLKVLLEKIKYTDHKWDLCGDLKILTILLGLQTGFTRHPCHLCLWNSRDRKNHYVKKIWPARKSFVAGSQNVEFEPLVDPSKILIPPLHIKLGLMKQFTKALDKEGQCFRYLYLKFPKYSDAKIKEGVFDGPQIRKLLQDPDFITQMNTTEKAAWNSFKEVVKNFLGNRKSSNYKKIVSNMVRNFKKLGCLMNLKLHYLDSHIDDFPKNLGDYSEEQGERFHQDIKVMENRYQGRWDDRMLSDYCWSLKRDRSNKQRKRKFSGRKSVNRSFAEKRTRYSRKKKVKM